jgi:hypothetical protein
VLKKTGKSRHRYKRNAYQKIEKNEECKFGVSVKFRTKSNTHQRKSMELKLAPGQRE